MTGAFFTGKPGPPHANTDSVAGFDPALQRTDHLFFAVIPESGVTERITQTVQRLRTEHRLSSTPLDMLLPKYIRDARIFLHARDSNTVARFRIAEVRAGFARAATVKAAA
jgi:hypothetical protein